MNALPKEQNQNSLGNIAAPSGMAPLLSFNHYSL
jgi:hypothetical protein